MKMRTRQKVSRRKDRKIFSRTASRVDARNIPGKVIQRGGTRL